MTPEIGKPWTWGHGTFDFETFSESGFCWNEATQKFEAPDGARTKGLGVVNANVYTEHPSAEVLTLTYRLPRWPHYTGTDPQVGAIYEIRGGDGDRRWRPGDPLPTDLFDFLTAGGILEAFNVMFERLAWTNICVPKYGWPALDPWVYQLRCAMAKARVNSLPGKLANLGAVLNLNVRKDANGKRLLDKFSIPRNPTKKDPRRRIMPDDEPAEFEALQGYCDTDVATETEASAHPRMEDMTDAELLFWWIDQEINWRGVAIDREGVRNCIVVLKAALQHYGDECRAITGFDPTQLAELRGWLAARGVHMDSMDEEHVSGMLARLPPPPPGVIDPRRRVLELRALIGSASVKKLFAMENQGCRDDRLRNLIVHHGARTGRPTGEGPQPLNLPRSGPDLFWCGQTADGKGWDATGCRRPFRPTLDGCPWCGKSSAGLKKRKWSPAGCDAVLEIMKARSLELVEWFFGDALLAISGCLRGLFVAGPGKELIASDFIAIEAVVTAMLSKCQWRIDVFRSRRDIYLMSASKITGTPVEAYEAYRLEHGDNHPDRQKIGKVAELALGFMGWIAAWRNFDSTDMFTDDQVKANILAWRDASPEIPELAGGQSRGFGRNATQEYFGFEGAAVQAIQWPGQTFTVAGVKFCLEGFVADVVADVVEVDYFLYGDNEPHVAQRIVKPGSRGTLVITLLSGRRMKYHDPALSPSTRPYARPGELQITYWTWNTNTQYGPPGWVVMSTYAGKLIENIVQAIAHDILRHAIINLRAAGYPCVLHVYDEIVVEIPEGHGSIEEVERIMGIMPWWAASWPIFAAGGWRGFRYRKG